MLAGLFRRIGRSTGSRHVSGFEPELARALAAIETLNAQVSQLQASVDAMSGSRNVNLHLPFTQRTQALKMVRDGRSAKQISAALGLPHGEVLLLTRVQEVQMGPPQPAPVRRKEPETSFAAALRQLTEQTGEKA